MTELRKKVSVFLVLALLFTFLVPAPGTVPASPQSGEGVSVSAVVYGDSGGLEPAGTGANSVTAEVYGPLQIVEKFPAPGATEVPLDTEIYIQFNKPVNITKLGLGHIAFLGGGSHDLTPSPDRTKWFLAPGSASLEGGKTYNLLIMPMMVMSLDMPPETLTLMPDPLNPWTFTTQEAIANPPASIEITDCPSRLQVGRSYPLGAVVKDKKGDVLDWPVDWQVISVSNGRATVDGQGNLTGTVPGLLMLTARPRDYPNITSRDTAVEIRQNFDQHLLGLWATELTGREMYATATGAPLVGADGAIYLTTGGGNPVTRAYDSDGNVKEGFQEITGVASPALADIGGREYLLGARDKKMCAFDPLSGRLEWQSEALEYGGLGKAVVDLEGNIYAPCLLDGKVYAFSLDSDRYRWSYYVQYEALDGDYSGRVSPITVGPGSLLYVAGENGKVFCLDSRGQLRWQYAAPTPGRKIPAGLEVDSAGNVYFLQTVHDSEYNIYSLDPAGGYRWSVNKTDSGVKNLFVDQDDSLYVTIKDEAAGAEKLTRLNPADGSPQQEFGVYGCDRFMRPGDGHIYTNKFIFNENLEAVGYTDLEAVGYADDYYRSLPYMRYSPLALCPGGALARVVISEGTAVALEKVGLVNTADSEPATVEVGQSELTLYQGGAHDIFAQVKDSQGYIIPYLALEYAVGAQAPEDPAVLLVAEVSEAGRITALNPGTAQITVTVQGYPGVQSIIGLQVLARGEISRMYFINRPPDPRDARLDEEITAISGVVGEEQNVQVVVLDQHGALIPDLPVKWTLDGSEVVQMYNYAGTLMGTSKNEAVLNGLKEGVTTLKAEIDGFEGLSATLAVKVASAPYEILWTLPIAGDWDYKIAYHSQAGDGTLFIVNHKKLKAVSSAGALLWEQDIVDQYGFEPAPPLLDEESVYVYDSSGFNLALVALGQGDGGRRWSFNGGLGSVQQVRAGAGAVYLLAGGGRLYGLEQDSGRSLWESPLNMGSGDITLGLSTDGNLYYTRGHQVFRVNGDGSASLLYTGATGTALVIKEITAGGSIVIESEKGGVYSILSLDPAGGENWEVPVQATVELNSAGGVVYAVTVEMVNPRVYFIGEDGTIQADQVLGAPAVKNYKLPGKYSPPLIGSDGIAYIPLNQLYAVNAADGRLLWTGNFKDGFFNRAARCATLDQNNILYLACDDAGFLALRSKVAGVADESGFYIDISGIGALKGNTYRNIAFRVRNDNEVAKEVRVLMALEEAEGAKVLNYAATADLLAAGADKAYNYGVQIPGAGGHRISIRLLDQDNQLITQKILPVS